MGGSTDPYINVIFTPIQGDEPQIVSLIIFGWEDVLDVGVPDEDGLVILPWISLTNRKYISAILHQSNADYVHRNILENFLLLMHLHLDQYLQRR